MVQAMKSLASMDGCLNVDERNLLSVAYKNIVGARRASWRILQSIEAKEDGKSYEGEAAGKHTDRLASIAEYKEKVEVELRAICDELQTLIQTMVLDGEPLNSEAKVFYYKMAADYFRYRAEFEKGAARDEAADSASTQYETANKFAQALVPTSPIRLGLALNYSVFYYEIMHKESEACNLAKTAFDCAIAELDDLEEANYKDATLIMQLLRDNLALWTQRDGGDDDDDY